MKIDKIVQSPSVYYVLPVLYGSALLDYHISVFIRIAHIAVICLKIIFGLVGEHSLLFGLPSENKVADKSQYGYEKYDNKPCPCTYGISVLKKDGKSGKGNIGKKHQQNNDDNSFSDFHTHPPGL